MLSHGGASKDPKELSLDNGMVGGGERDRGGVDGVVGEGGGVNERG